MFPTAFYSTRHYHQLDQYALATRQWCRCLWCDLVVYIDADLTMSSHITATVRACFAALRQIRSVRRSLTREALLTLLRALVITNVDYCFSTLAGVSSALLQRLQSVLNDTARLVFSARRSEHITPLPCILFGTFNQCSSREVVWCVLIQLGSDVYAEQMSTTAPHNPFVCSDASLPPWHCATVPCWDTSVDGWCTRMSSSPVCFDVDTRRTTDTLSHHWWLCISGCCVACLEFPSNFGQGNPVTACMSAGNWKQHCLPSLFWQTDCDII